MISGLATDCPQNDLNEKNLNNNFDELTKNLAQSVTRRAALKTFGVGLAGMALACLGLANKAQGGAWQGQPCKKSGTNCGNVGNTKPCDNCCHGYWCSSVTMKCYCG